MRRALVATALVLTVAGCAAARGAELSRDSPPALERCCEHMLCPDGAACFNGVCQTEDLAGAAATWSLNLASGNTIGSASFVRQHRGGRVVNCGRGRAAELLEGRAWPRPLSKTARSASSPPASRPHRNTSW